MLSFVPSLLTSPFLFTHNEHMPDQPTVPQPPQENPQRTFQISFPVFPRDNRSIVIIILILVLGGFGGYLYARQQSVQDRQTVTVVGNASMEVQADKALIEGATEAKSTTYDGATQDNKRKIDNIRAALTVAGLSEKKLKIVDSFTDQEIDYDVIEANPRAESSTSGTPMRYYSVTSFEITLEKDELRHIDKYMDVLTNYNAEPYATYSLQDKQTQLLRLKEEAVLDARRQAENLAKTNNLTIKKVLLMQDRETEEDPEFFYEPAYTSDSKTITLTASYEVKYELGPKLLPF